MNDIQEILNQLLDKWSQDTINEMLRRIDQQDIKWRGILRRSLAYQITDQGVDFLMADYGQFIDEGTGIFGPRRQRIPKRSIPGMAYHLKAWASSKNLNPWAVATKIQQRGGIPAKPFFKSVIEQRLQTQQAEIQQGLQDYITQKIQNAVK